MKGFLFDTCTIRFWYAKNQLIEEKVNALPAEAFLYVSPVTIGEIEFGHASSASSDPTKSAEFRKWISNTFEVPEVPIIGSTAWEYANFRRRLFSRFTRVDKFTENHEDSLGSKLSIDENDLWLAAQACERNLTLVTSDKMARIREVVDSDIDVEYWPPA